MASEAMEPGQGGEQLQESERERVIRKIKRCLALGKSANANEAETALRQARAMMDKYRLSETDIELSEVGAEARATGKFRLSKWQRYLAETAAKMFRCELLTAHYVGGSYTFTFVGVMPAAELAAYAYDALYEQLQAARKAYQREQRGRGGKVSGDDFAIAWVHAVRKKIEAFAEANTWDEGQSKALVVVEGKERQAIANWVRAKYENAKPAKEWSPKIKDANAVRAGWAAGQEAQLNQAMHGRAEGPLTLAAG